MKKWISTFLALLMILGTCSVLVFAGGENETSEEPAALTPEEEILPLSLEDVGREMQEEGPEVEADPDDLTRAEDCDRCGKGTIRFRYYYYGPWLSTPEVRECDCGDLPYGISATHDVQERTVDKIYSCDTCTYTYSLPYTTQEREYCNYHHRWIDN